MSTQETIHLISDHDNIGETETWCGEEFVPTSESLAEVTCTVCLKAAKIFGEGAGTRLQQLTSNGQPEMAITTRKPFLIWRCKSCQAEYREELSPMADSVRNILQTRNDRPLMAYNLHTCDGNGNIGVGELIGGNENIPPDDDQEAEPR